MKIKIKIPRGWKKLRPYQRIKPGDWWVNSTIGCPIEATTAIRNNWMVKVAMKPCFYGSDVAFIRRKKKS